jgi:hypothetical protein
MWIACMLRELGEGLKVDFLYIVIEDKKKLSHIMENRAKQYKENNNKKMKNDHNIVHKGTTTHLPHRLQDDKLEK